ncbi:MAG: hypothetical protein AB7O56_08755 [Bauldia sp.]
MVTAGAWLPDLLGAPFASLFEIRRQVLYWFAVRDEDALALLRPSRFPVFIWLVHGNCRSTASRPSERPARASNS